MPHEMATARRCQHDGVCIAGLQGGECTRWGHVGVQGGMSECWRAPEDWKSTAGFTALFNDASIRMLTKPIDCGLVNPVVVGYPTG
jgi:hypothetical protein